MSQQLQPVVFGVLDVPREIEEAFRSVLIEPEVGYYRSLDMEPFLPYWAKNGIPASYYVKNSKGENEIVRDLTQTRGDVYDEEGFFRCRIFKQGEVTLSPQIPALGHRIVKEFLMTYIEMTRAWLPYSEDKVLGTGSLYHRFKKFIKLELMEDFAPQFRAMYTEDPMYLNEITMDYLNREQPIPVYDHAFTEFLKTIIANCQRIIIPVRQFIMSNPWQEFELSRLNSGDYLLIPRGDFRINQWEKQVVKK